MFKIFLLIVGLAAYGAHAMYAKLVPPSQDGTTTSISFTGLAIAAVGPLMGLTVQSIPAVGCLDSVPAPGSLATLLAALSPSQSIAVTMLTEGVSAAPAALPTFHWYAGELGVGLCLPSQHVMVLLPDSLRATIGALLPANS